MLSGLFCIQLVVDSYDHPQEHLLVDGLCEGANRVVHLQRQKVKDYFLFNIRVQLVRIPNSLNIDDLGPRPTFNPKAFVFDKMGMRHKNLYFLQLGPQLFPFLKPRIGNNQEVITLITSQLSCGFYLTGDSNNKEPVTNLLLNAHSLVGFWLKITTLLI